MNPGDRIRYGDHAGEVLQTLKSGRLLVALDGFSTASGLRMLKPEALTLESPPPVFPSMGIVSGLTLATDPPNAKKLGAKVVKVEFDIGTPASTIAANPAVKAHLANGMKLCLLAGFYGRVPTAAEARNLGEWARALPNHIIEFGNETSYGYQYGDGYADASYVERAKAYARAAVDAIVTIAGRATFIVQGEDGGSGSDVWVKSMFSAVPNLASFVGGWTCHPYGGLGSLDRMIKFLAAQGVTNPPLYITEVGVSSDDGRITDRYWHEPYTYGEAAAVLKSQVRQIRAKPNCKLVLLYQSHDQANPGYTDPELSADEMSELYFGLLKHDGSDKGAITATAKALLAL